MWTPLSMSNWEDGCVHFKLLPFLHYAIHKSNGRLIYYILLRRICIIFGTNFGNVLFFYSFLSNHYLILPKFKNNHFNKCNLTFQQTLESFEISKIHFGRNSWNYWHLFNTFLIDFFGNKMVSDKITWIILR